MNKIRPSVLILGGGVAGMSAAKVLDSRGINVHLVEKSAHLGGKAFDWACMATDECQYCGACLSAELVDQITSLDRTQVYLESEVAKIKSDKSGFTVDIEGRKKSEINVRAILIATGLDLFDPSDLKFFEYNSDKVITTAELNSVLKEERLLEVLSHKQSPSVAFIQCVGSRNRELGLDYCSQVCCKTSVRQANKILHQIPEALITIFHIDLQNFGKLFRSQVALMGDRVKLVQGVPAKILSSPEKDQLTVIQEDANSGARMAFDFDMAVLAIGVRAGDDTRKIAEYLDVNADKWGFFSENTLSADKGIYAVGTAAGPTDILTAIEQGKSTALNILRTINNKAIPDQSEQRLAIIGDGPEGHKTALSLAEAGYPVLLFCRGDHEVPDHDGITVFPETRIAALSGVAGRFHISAEAGDRRLEKDVSAIIVASGAESRPLSEQKFLSFNEYLISLDEFYDQFMENPDNVPQNIAFWLDHEGPEWKVSARKALNMAMGLREKRKSATIIMEKMPVHGLEGQMIYDKARKLSVKFLRVSTPSQVRLNKNGRSFFMEIDEATLAGVTLKLPCDLLVVPRVIQASPRNRILAGILGQLTDREGFLQSPNVRHRLTGSPKRGIFFVGSCHDETDDRDLDLEIEAIKTSLCSLATERFNIDNHAVIDEGKCAKCLTCYRSCPHGAIILKEEFQPLVIEEACFGCGICVSGCPAEAISQENGRDAILDDIQVRETVIFACERSAALAENSLRQIKEGYNKDGDIRVIPVQCAGSLDVKTIMEPFLMGAEKVLVAACHEGNCRSMKGGSHAAVRIRRVRDETNISPSSLDYCNISANEPIKMLKIVSQK